MNVDPHVLKKFGRPLTFLERLAFRHNEFQVSYPVKIILRLIGVLFWVPVAIFIFIGPLVLPFFAWNWLAPAYFRLPEISYLQFLLLCVLLLCVRVTLNYILLLLKLPFHLAGKKDERCITTEPIGGQTATRPDPNGS